jgi:hypothetical protein
MRKECFIKEVPEGEESEEPEEVKGEEESEEGEEIEGFEFGDDGDDDGDDGVSLEDIMGTYFTTEDGKNIADTVASLKDELKKQNKTLAILCGLIQKYISTLQ